jgi:hypothetical protein
MVTAKFDALCEPHASPELRREIGDAVRRLEAIDIADLTGLLRRVGREEGGTR